MSHTTEIGEFYIIHNGDFSGDIQITVRDGMKDGVPNYRHIAAVPYWLVERIVVTKIKQERIAAIESAGSEELLGYKHTGPTYD